MPPPVAVVFALGKPALIPSLFAKPSGSTGPVKNEKLGTCEGVAEAGHTARRSANGRTRGMALCQWSPVGRPRERALTRSLRDLTPAR